MGVVTFLRPCKLPSFEVFRRLTTEKTLAQALYTTRNSLSLRVERGRIPYVCERK